MGCVREHVDGLHDADAVVTVKDLQVAGLRRGVTAHVDNALRGGTEDGLHYVRMHAGTRRVGDDDVGATMVADEFVGQDVLHVARIEQGVCNAVDFGVHLGVLDGFRHILYADDLPSLTGHEVGDGAGAGIEVVDEFTACQLGKLAGHTV